MENKEFNLSERILNFKDIMTQAMKAIDVKEPYVIGDDLFLLYHEDVQKFIRLLKEELEAELTDFKEHHTITRSLYPADFLYIIDKLAGDKLI